MVNKIPSMPNDDQDFLLIQCIIRQDRAAFSTLYDRYAQVVYALAYRHLDSVIASEEIVVDVFTKVWMTAASYNSQAARVDSWIFMITLRLVHERLGSKRLTGVTETIATTDMTNID